MNRLILALSASSLLLAACQQQAGETAPVASAVAPATASQPAPVKGGPLIEVNGLALDDVYDLEALAVMAARVSEVAETCAIGIIDLQQQMQALDAAAPVPKGQNKGWVGAAYAKARKDYNLPADSAACESKDKAAVLRMVERLRGDLAAPAFKSWLTALKV